MLRVTAQFLLDDRILTRLVQGFGRCTRSPNDYAAVIVLGIISTRCGTLTFSRRLNSAAP